MKKMQVAILLMVLCVVGVSSATRILWCSDRATNDQPFVDLLIERGYTVDRLAAANVMDADKVALANTYDLVFVGRDVNSGNYVQTGEVALWNSITAPMICQSAYLWRSGKWKWLNNDTIFNTGTDVKPVLVSGDTLYDALFNGVTLNENGAFTYYDGSSLVAVTMAESAGNGTLIATRDYADDPFVYIAYWQQGIEFYSGSGQYANGPRMALAGGGGIGQYNLTDQGALVFLNAVYYMSGATFDRKPYASAGTDRVVNANEMTMLDATAFDPDSALTVSWTQLSGPATAIFEDAAVIDPAVTFPAKGVYELEITVTDGTTPVFDQITVIVRDNADNAMIAHWDFESLPDPNTLTDVTGHGFTGIFYKTDGGDPNVTAGNMIGGSQAADMTAGNAYWEAASSYDDTDPNFNDLATGMTVATWVKITDPSVAYPVIIGNGLDGWRFGINEGVYNFVCQDAGFDLRGPSAYNDNWHHVVGVFDGVAAQTYIYLDGVLAASLGTAQGTLLSKGDDYPMIQIANRGDGDRPFKGYIDDIRVYNYPLTDGEIASLASEGNLAVSVTAGEDQSIIFKGEPVQLAGELLIDDGYPAPATLAWSVVSVPAGVDPGALVISDGTIEAPTVTFPNVEGAYGLRLTADDTEFTVSDDVTVTLTIPACADVLADGLGMAADISGPADVADCRVDIYDLAAMAADWLRCNDPEDAGCEWAYQQ